MNNRLLFVFDWDGTLVDSVAHIVECLRLAARDLRLADHDDAHFANVIGLGLATAVELLYPGITPPVVDEFRVRYMEHFIRSSGEPLRFFPEALEVLGCLRERGHRLAVATGKSRRGLDRSLGDMGMRHYFDATRCADEAASKPDPRMLHELMSELGAGANGTVMIGDTEYDMEMAVRAGTHRVAVDYGAHDAQRLLKYEPSLVIGSLTELLTWNPYSTTQDRAADCRKKFGQ